MAKLSDKQKMMAYKTGSDIPKTQKEKRRWIQARRLVAKEVGRYKEGEIPWGLVTHIYKLEGKAGKTIKPSEIAKQREVASARKYRTQTKPKPWPSATRRK